MTGIGKSIHGQIAQAYRTRGIKGESALLAAVGEVETRRWREWLAEQKTPDEKRRRATELDRARRLKWRRKKAIALAEIQRLAVEFGDPRLTAAVGRLAKVA